MSMPWSKFFWSDYEADQGLRLCSLAAQGMWMRMLCVCAKGDPKGYLAVNGQPLDSTGVARLCGITADEAEALMVELFANGVFSRDRRGWVYSRRMVRDSKASASGKKHAAKRWLQPTDKPKENTRPNGGASGSPTTQKPEARSQKVGSSEPTKAREALCRVLSPETADAFIAHRKAMRAPLTAKAAELIAGKLAGSSAPDADALRSIERGWRSVFPDEPPANVTPFPSHGGTNGQLALTPREAAATDAFRERHIAAARSRSASAPDFGDG